MLRKTAVAFLLLSFCVPAVLAADVQSVWLDDLDISKALAGWGTSQADKSVDSHPLSIGGRTFERGLGTHADGQFNIQLDGRAVRFSAMVGVDSEVEKRGSVVFVVVGDDRLLFESKTLKGGDPAEKVDVDLKGIKHLRLLVSGGDDGIAYDHADWAMAKIDYTGEAPLAVEPVRPKPYILTPKPGPAPRITGPSVFGVRPGNPFLFTVTATGTRPMTFNVKGLPKGLKLDAATGIITGVVEAKGEYQTTVTAKNAAGTAERGFKIVVGDTICLTPPMGWNSWNCWACAIDDGRVRAAARSMAESGLMNHGWSYINIDDCWMRKRGTSDPIIGEPVRDENGRYLCNAKFPDMKALTDYIHGLGLRAGIYSGPGPTTCQGYEACWQHELQDAQQFAEWGFDYLKYDWCGYSDVSGNQTLEELQRPYILMRKMLDQAGRDIVYSLCQYGWGDVWKWGGQIGGNCWRTTGDINDSWGSMAGIGFAQADLYPYAKPGQWNDPDMLVVGKVGWGPNLHDSSLTPDEQYTHISLWCMLSSPLLIGCPIDGMDEFTTNLLTNDEVLDVNQDPLGQQARRVQDSGQVQVWTKQMQDGSKAVAFFNMSAFETKTASVDWKTLELAPDAKQRVRDLWRQKDVGTFTGSFTAPSIPPHGVLMLRLFAQ
jgi:alpha-galactosidase